MKKLMLFSMVLFLVISAAFADKRDDHKPGGDDRDKRGEEGDRGRGKDGPGKDDRGRGKGPRGEEKRQRLDEQIERFEHEIMWIEEELEEAPDEVRPFLERMLEIRNVQVEIVEQAMENFEEERDEDRGGLFDELTRLNNEYRLAETEYSWAREKHKLTMFMEEQDKAVQKEAGKIIKELDKVYKKKISTLQKMNALQNQALDYEEELRGIRDHIDQMVGEEEPME